MARGKSPDASVVAVILERSEKERTSKIKFQKRREGKRMKEMEKKEKRWKSWTQPHRVVRTDPISDGEVGT